MTWHTTVDYIHKTGSSRLHFIAQLKQSKMLPSPKDITKVYATLVRPLLEYASPVWHGGLTDQQDALLESIQERAMKLAFPTFTYQESLDECNLPTLSSRRELACKRLFEAMQHPAHKLHDFLSPKKERRYESQSNKAYVLPKVRTDRFKDSFMPYYLFNF